MECGWLVEGCPGDIEVEASRVRRIQECEEPEEKCFRQKGPKVQRCPGRQTLHTVEEMALSRRSEERR